MPAPRTSWLIAGRCCAAAGWLLWIAVQVVADDPLTILDGAHNPGGMRALAGSLADHREPLVAVLSVLDDKDATEMLRALLPLCDEVVCTSNANPRALLPATLASLAVGILLPTVIVKFAFDTAIGLGNLLLLSLVFALAALSVYRFVHASGLVRRAAADVADRT